MPAPRCEHCSYDLSGIQTVDFIALCPECGRPSDTRKTPPPTFPGWHTPFAILIGCLTYALLFGAYLLVAHLTKGVPPRLQMFAFPGLPAISAAASIFTLRRNYAALWKHRYPSTPWPLRGLLSLFVDWFLWTILYGFLPYTILWAIAWLWP